MSDDMDGRGDIDAVRRFRDGAAPHASVKASPIHPWWRDVDTALKALDYEHLLRIEQRDLAMSDDVTGDLIRELDIAAAVHEDGCCVDLAAERDALLAIVTALAAVDPTGFDPDCCTLCRRVIVPAGEPHSDTCPWVRARALCTPPPATPEETE